MHLVIKKSINKESISKENGSAVRDDEPHGPAPLTEEPGYIGR